MPGEEGPADTECQGGQAVEGGQRAAEGAGGSGDGAESHGATYEPDPPTGGEPERAEVRRSESARR